ncbi:MAG: hypothetical protein AABZ30_01895 [Myxococcota bacterium]
MNVPHRDAWRFLAGFASLAAATLASRNVAAETVAVIPFSGINVHPGYLEAAQDLLRTHLAEGGKFQVVPVRGAPTSQEATAAEAVSLARTVGADLAVAAHLTRLAGTARVHVTVYRVSDAQAVRSDTLNAGSPDDIDAVLARLARAIVTGKPARDNADIETVTEKEADAYQKRTATHVFGLRLGAMVPINRAEGGSGAVPGGSLFWLYDARTFLADVSLLLFAKGDDAYDNDDSSAAIGLGLGAYYPLSRSDLTPYVGGGVHWWHTEFGGRGAGGLAPHADVGILMGRLATVQVRGELGYFVNTFGEREGDAYFGSDGSSGEKHYSHGPIMSVGIGF